MDFGRGWDLSQCISTAEGMTWFGILNPGFPVDLLFCHQICFALPSVGWFVGVAALFSRKILSA